jgi:hypothetical protein
MTEEIKAYCMKCKAERTIQGVQIVMTKNGRPAANGTCPVCGTKMFKFLPSSYKSQITPASVAETPAAATPAASEPAPVAESAPVSEPPAA